MPLSYHDDDTIMSPYEFQTQIGNIDEIPSLLYTDLKTYKRISKQKIFQENMYSELVEDL